MSQTQILPLYWYKTRRIPKNLTIPWHTCLGMITEYDEEGCYNGTVDDLKIASLWENKSYNKIRLANKITIYGNNKNTTEQLVTVANTHPDVWNNTEKTINILKSDYLQVPLRENADVEKLLKKVYPLGDSAWQVVNDAFNKLHEWGKMDWSTKPTPSGFPVFVVWKTVTDRETELPQRKGQPVIDICGLNQLTQPDSYSLPLQSDITAAIRGCDYISNRWLRLVFLPVAC